MITNECYNRIIEIKNGPGNDGMGVYQIGYLTLYDNVIIIITLNIIIIVCIIIVIVKVTRTSFIFSIS